MLVPSPATSSVLVATSSLELARQKRRRHNRLGWGGAVGTVRMLGTFLENPIDVPRVVVDHVAEQLGIDDPSCVKEYAERVPMQYERAWEIRELLGFREFVDAEEEIVAFVASRVAKTGFAVGAVRPGGAPVDRKAGAAAGDHDAGAAGP